MTRFYAVLYLGLSALASSAVIEKRQSLANCPGYAASNVQENAHTITADLNLGGAACNIYGQDLTDLRLLVEYQTDTRLHVKIYDAAEAVYQVPESVLPRPPAGPSSSSSSQLVFNFSASPFSFSVSRNSTGEVLFDTSGAPIVFESQYLRLRTNLPNNPNLYGLGEHTDPFRLNTTNYTRTIWNRDAYLVPPGSNLYGDHPVYFDHRASGNSHAVFLLNSNGMDVFINQTTSGQQYLEYNTLGGVFDFYFLAGPTPRVTAQQYAAAVGYSAMMPYWGLGFHQCRYGMQDVYEVAGVVTNYSVANIPLETMWTDIDYMDLRKVFTLDPLRFPLNLMQQLVTYLHQHQQHYIVMVDPAVAYQNYPAFNNGAAVDSFLKVANGSWYNGVVWPGVTVFPDWFHPDTQGYWNNEFLSFFDPVNGIDIDALWIDMNEASNFCVFPCNDPFEQAAQMGDPPQPPAVRLGSPYPVPGFPADFQPQCVAQVQFNVYAQTYYGENIVILGNALTLGNGDIANGAAPLSASNYPTWSALIDLPTNTVVTYQYVRTEEGGGYIYENTNRTLTTGGCDGTILQVHDNITTAEGTPPSSKAKRDNRPLVVAGTIRFEKRQAAGSMLGLPGRDLLNPAYQINNAAGSISNKTLNTDLIHYNGLAEYDTHNLYGTMMSVTSRDAMYNRRPGLRPMVITRSTFAGAGSHVGHWLGDNNSDWDHYRISIAELMEFAALFQVPMVGSDVCGYAGNPDELLCARWAMLGAFSPFYRNHKASGVPPQEYYRWPLVAEAARAAIAARYQLLDYIYTSMYIQNTTGTPLINPMFFLYPHDANTFGLDLQYFYGDSLLVAPVTQENATSVDIYLPSDQFYDWWTLEPVRGTGANLHLPDVPFTSIPLYIRGGAVLPLRISSANTTTELRKQGFNIVIAPGLDGSAFGQLYLDDGVSLVQAATSFINFTYTSTSFGGPFGRGFSLGELSMSGKFAYAAGINIEQITLLGVGQQRWGSLPGQAGGAPWTSCIGTNILPTYNATSGTLTYKVDVPLTEPFKMQVGWPF